MYLIGTLHNRRGDPVVLERLLKHLILNRGVRRISLTWSVPSGSPSPGITELREEVHRLQSAMRACVSIVNASRLARPCHAILGRAYRSFQYEVTTLINSIYRNFKNIEFYLVDDPSVREFRYREIGYLSDTLHSLSRVDHQSQAATLLKDYARFDLAYDDERAYCKLLEDGGLAPLLEIHPRIGFRRDEREEYMVELIEEVRSDLHIARLAHCISPQPTELTTLNIVSRVPLIERIRHLDPNLITLGDAPRMFGIEMDKPR